MQIKPLIDVDTQLLNDLLEREKAHLRKKYYWDVEYAIRIKQQLVRHHRLSGLAAVEGSRALGYLIWHREEQEFTLTGYYFDENEDESQELIFLDRAMGIFMGTKEPANVQGQLLGINTQQKRIIFEKYGFDTTSREYMFLDLEEFEISHEQEEEFLLNAFPDNPLTLSGFLQELAYSMYRSYFGTKDSEITGSFAELEGCRKFIANLFEYPVYGEIDSRFSFYARDIQKGLIGMILVSNSEQETCHVVQISVVPWYQSVGVGKTLMRAALKRIKEEGRKRVILMVTTENDRAVNLYKKLGFYSISSFYSLNLEKKR